MRASKQVATVPVDALKDGLPTTARPETCLTAKVGNGRTNHRADVRWVKEAFKHLGRYDAGPEPHGYIDRELLDAIYRYQRDCGLRCDGWLRPGGETENTLRVELIRLGQE